MSDHKVTVEQLPSGKWACFLHVTGREFKNEEQAENWLDVSESLTAIDMMLRKYKK